MKLQLKNDKERKSQLIFWGRVILQCALYQRAYGTLIMKKCFCCCCQIQLLCSICCRRCLVCLAFSPNSLSLFFLRERKAAAHGNKQKTSLMFPFWYILLSFSMQQFYQLVTSNLPRMTFTFVLAEVVLTKYISQWIILIYYYYYSFDEPPKNQVIKTKTALCYAYLLFAMSS